MTKKENDGRVRWICDGIGITLGDREYVRSYEEWIELLEEVRSCRKPVPLEVDADGSNKLYLLKRRDNGNNWKCPECKTELFNKSVEWLQYFCTGCRAGWSGMSITAEAKKEKGVVNE